MKKKRLIKRACMLLLTACLLTGTVQVVNQAVTVTAQASTSTNKKLKSKATKIVDKKVKKKDSKKTKLKKLFQYVEKSYGYKRTIGFKTYKGWEKDYALEMYNDKKGSCYHFAAAYAFLAKKATGYNVRIGIGKTNGFSGKLQQHAWVEIKIKDTWYICDPNMDKFAEDCSGKYFLVKRSKLKKTYNNYKKVKYVNVTF